MQFGYCSNNNFGNTRRACKHPPQPPELPPLPLPTLLPTTAPPPPLVPVLTARERVAELPRDAVCRREQRRHGPVWPRVVGKVRPFPLQPLQLALWNSGVGSKEKKKKE